MRLRISQTSRKCSRRHETENLKSKNRLWDTYQLKKNIIILIFIYIFAGLFHDLQAGQYMLSQNLPGLSDGKIMFGDYNNDGNIDLVAIGDGVFRVYKNIDANFTLDQSLIGLDIASIDLFDFDNDGWLDIIACGSGGTSRLLIYKNNNSTFSLYQQPMGESDGIEYGDVRSGDFENDGD